MSGSTRSARAAPREVRLTELDDDHRMLFEHAMSLSLDDGALQEGEA